MSKRSCSPTFSLQRIVVRPCPSKTGHFGSSNLEPRTTNHDPFVMGLPLPLAACLSRVGPPSDLGGGSARAVLLLVSQSALLKLSSSQSVRALIKNLHCFLQ